MFKSWLNNLEEQENIINDLMDKHQMILFFNHGGQFFGAPEDSRLIFAKLKSKDEDDPMTGFSDDIRFMATNLLNSLSGEPHDSLFGMKDIPKITVCDRDDVVKKITKNKKKKK